MIILFHKESKNHHRFLLQQVKSLKIQSSALSKKKSALPAQHYREPFTAATQFCSTMTGQFWAGGRGNSQLAPTFQTDRLGNSELDGVLGHKSTHPFEIGSMSSLSNNSSPSKTYLGQPMVR